MLIYSLVGITDTIVLTVSTPLQHSLNFAMTKLIYIESQAAKINFVNDPPSKVNINEIFTFSVQASINSGAVL